MSGAELPVLKSDEVLRVLLHLGFSPKRKRGSHLILAKGRRLVVVPVHKGRDIPRGTLRNIIRQAGLTKVDWVKFY